MRSLVPATLTIALSLPALGHAQTPAASKEPAAKIAEVRFGDGSVVRMTLLQEKLDVMTRYGKLSVPLADIRRVEFGLHVPATRCAEIHGAIKLLGSDVYRDREGATRDLLQAGYWACPALERASKSTDAETAQRQAGAQADQRQDLARSAPPQGRRCRPHERVYHRRPHRRADAAGAVAAFRGSVPEAVRPAAMHIRRQCNTGEMLVDAAKYGCEPDQWLDTGVSLDPSMRLVVVVKGQVDLWPQTPGQYLAGPKGYNAVGKGTQFMAGSLIARIGENGKPFVVGERYEGSVGEEGKLFLHIVPSPWNAPSMGSFHVRVHTDPVALTSTR